MKKLKCLQGIELWTFLNEKRLQINAYLLHSNSRIFKCKWTNSDHSWNESSLLTIINTELLRKESKMFLLMQKWIYYLEFILIHLFKYELFHEFKFILFRNNKTQTLKLNWNFTDWIFLGLISSYFFFTKNDFLAF